MERAKGSMTGKRDGGGDRKSICGPVVGRGLGRQRKR